MVWIVDTNSDEVSRSGSTLFAKAGHSGFSRTRVDNSSVFYDLFQILGQDNHGYGSEHSKVDPRKKKMTLQARNVSTYLYHSVIQNFF